MIEYRPLPAWLLFATLACGTALCPQPGCAHPAAFTLAQIMQAPFPSSLTAAPRGGAVAWVFDAKGRRNIWVAEPTGGTKAHAITSFDEDDGSHIDDLAWSADEASIAFTRGGSIEDDQPANVDSAPSGPKPREVWVASRSGAPARRIGAGHSPSFSPDGTRLLYLDKRQILTAAVGGGAPQPLIVDKGMIESVTWSADGKLVAFVSDRGSHALVGVYDFSRQSIAWMSPGLDRDTSPVFSKDGSRIAFIRVPAERAPPFISRRSGQCWSIWIADVRSGAGRAIWTADAGAGSVFAPTLSPRNLFWNAADQLVFPWERSGWLQLYAVPVGVGTARALTAGRSEITHTSLSADGRRIAYSASKEGEPDRLHIFALDTDRGSARILAADTGIEDTPQINNAGAVFALRSDGTHPLQPVMLSSNNRWEALAPQQIPADFPSAQLVTPEAVTFRAEDGHEVHAQLFAPQDRDAKPRPAILFFHGGPRRQMLVGFHPMGAYNWMYCLNQYLAAKGYIVLSVNYRGGIGYGLEYREADDFGPGGGSELHDLLGAVAYLKARKDVDPAKLGIWGASYGGLMTALGLARAPDAFATGVDYAGVYNWATFLTSIGLPPDTPEATRRAVESSPIATIDRWRAPVLLVQADDDRAVPSQQASELLEALRSHHVPHEVVIIPDEIHDLARYASWMKLFDAAAAHFAAHFD